MLGDRLISVQNQFSPKFRSSRPEIAVGEELGTGQDDLMTAPPDDLPHLTFIERVMVQHAHPLKLACDSAGVIACFGLTWRRHMPAAMAVLFGSSILGSVLARTADPSQLVRTRLGRWMLGQAVPVNLLLRTLGFALALAGAWRHSAAFIVGGVGAIATARALAGRRC